MRNLQFTAVNVVVIDEKKEGYKNDLPLVVTNEKH